MEVAANDPPTLRPRVFPPTAAVVPTTHLDPSEALSSTVRIIYDILVRSSPQNIESALASTGIVLSSDVVVQVLKLSYQYPSSAVKFFRWAGLRLKLSAEAWNLMVDLLGKNLLFEPMWDAVRSMHQEGVLSMVTFTSIFSSYCAAGRVNDAVKSFEVMGRYGFPPDIFAANSMLSAICRDENSGGAAKALNFLENMKATTGIDPDEDSYAILLEGWEKEGNVGEATTTFGAMVVRIGWRSTNVFAYDAFLRTLVRGSQVEDALKFLRVMIGKGCLPSLKFFSDAFDILRKRNDIRQAILMWEAMVGNGLLPNLAMYNAMIALHCDNVDSDGAYRLLDEMVFNGAFPDSFTYNVIFSCLVKNEKVRDASKFFVEMVKNEFPPSPSSCAAAIKMFFKGEEPEIALQVWNFMLDNGVQPLDSAANALLLGLCRLGRLTKLRRTLEDMLDRRIDIYKSTMESLKNAYYKEGRSGRDKYENVSLCLIPHWYVYMAGVGDEKSLKTFLNANFDDFEILLGDVLAASCGTLFMELANMEKGKLQKSFAFDLRGMIYGLYQVIMVANWCPTTDIGGMISGSLWYLNLEKLEKAQEKSCGGNRYTESLDELVGSARLIKLSRTIEDMLDRRINIYESRVESLKNAYYKERRSGRDKNERWNEIKDRLLVVSKFAAGSLCYLHLKTLRKLKRNPVVVIEILKALMYLLSVSADVSGVRPFENVSPGGIHRNCFSPKACLSIEKDRYVYAKDVIMGESKPLYEEHYELAEERLSGIFQIVVRLDIWIVWKLVCVLQMFGVPQVVESPKLVWCLKLRTLERHRNVIDIVLFLSSSALFAPCIVFLRPPNFNSTHKEIQTCCAYDKSVMPMVFSIHQTNTGTSLTYDTTYMPTFFKLNHVHGLWLISKYGKNIIVGIVDSGAWPEHQSFEDVGIDSSDVFAGIDQTISDSVDVVSVSFHDKALPLYDNSVAIASFAAIEKGILVVCSAGNEGPTIGTIRNGFPWIVTVAAGTTNRWFAGTLTLNNDHLQKQMSQGLYLSPAVQTRPEVLIGVCQDSNRNSSIRRYDLEVLIGVCQDSNHNSSIRRYDLVAALVL
ncbi:hypothetical protein FNV43_RR09971 [Rhamnella rubrinervis]|uniref:Peptidase S8/S53 domain-containing protein n=1 Tax=Rhamnella rubrinervis TaxID=2594499 RepID=A0A8K0MKP4_9ROSA|nr:hypothetical protein FNV43_RR09971 [Rhamnella rubrinervis]